MEIIKFRPTRKMRIWAEQRLLQENIQYSDCSLLKKLGFGKNILMYWYKKHGENWTRWLDAQYGMHKIYCKGLIENHVLDLYLRSSFGSWKRLAKAYGVIQPQPRLCYKCQRADFLPKD